MAHANAALTPRHRLRLARLIVEGGWPSSRAAEFFHVSWRTADKWARRYREEGPAGMVDRCSARHTQHATTPTPVVRKIVHLRWKQRLGPVPIAAKLGMSASTVHAVLVRCHLNRLTHIDRVTGEPARRYERDRPGELIHVDVAYAEIHDDEKAATAAAVLYRAVAWFAERGVTVERVLSDNGSAYRSYLWRDTCADLGIKMKKTRPRRPQTNAKIERFHRTLADGWTHKKLYRSEDIRRAALAGWLHQYNHHRPHSAAGGLPPITGWTTWLGITASRSSGR